MQSGDVAPLGAAPTTPSAVNAADALLILRAAQGQDVDGDGLGSQAELAFRSSPFKADTDGDGVSDSVELAQGTDPRGGASTDSDGDGVTDAAEMAAGTDPFDGDTDGDGLPDATDPQPLRGVSFLHADQLGSTMLVTGANATVLKRVAYRPYGGTVAPASGQSATPRFGFTGQRFEAGIGIYDYKARFYDPALGRFLQPDSIVPDPGDPQSLNRYSYVSNNPVNLVDPSGNRPATPRDERPGGPAPLPKPTTVAPDDRLPPLIIDGEEVATVVLNGDGFALGIPMRGSQSTQDATQRGEQVGTLLGGGLVLGFVGGQGALSAVLANPTVAVETTVGLACGAACGPLNLVGGGATVAAASGKLDDAARGLFTSKDPLVGELANTIESQFPGLVKGVNVPLRDAQGKLVTDADILLDNAVLQVKSGNARGLPGQLLRTESATDLPVIGFAPNGRAGTLRAAEKNGSLVTSYK